MSDNVSGNLNVKWHLSDEYYISPSQLKMFEGYKEDWYKQYVLGESAFVQSLAMCVGTAFDWLVKKKLYADERLTCGGDDVAELKIGGARYDDMLAEHADEAMVRGQSVLEWYVACGAYDRLVERYVGAVVYLDRDVKRWIEGPRSMIHVRGKSDVTAVFEREGVSVYIDDWKVRGGASKSGASPTKGWYGMDSVVGLVKGAFPGSPIGGPYREDKEGVGGPSAAGPLFSLPLQYADQIALYGAIEGAEFGGRFVEGHIYECVCRPTGVRVASYKGVGTPVSELLLRLQNMWDLVRSDSVLTDDEIDVLTTDDDVYKKYGF